MYSEMLLEDEDGTHALRIEAGNVIHDEVERITALINNMLSLSRIELGNIKLERRRTRLNDLLEDAFATVGRDAKDKELELELELPGDAAAINVDKDLLRIAINNLLTNAIKYNRPGGHRHPRRARGRRWLPHLRAGHRHRNQPGGPRPRFRESSTAPIRRKPAA